MKKQKKTLRHYNAINIQITVLLLLFIIQSLKLYFGSSNVSLQEEEEEIPYGSQHIFLIWLISDILTKLHNFLFVIIYSHFTGFLYNVIEFTHRCVACVHEVTLICVQHIHIPQPPSPTVSTHFLLGLCLLLSP